MRRIFAALAAMILSASPAAAAFYAWDGSQWRQAVAVYGWDGSQWRAAQQAYGWDGSAWRQGFNACTPVTHTYTTPGSGNETVPTGARGLVAEAWGAGGSGYFGGDEFTYGGGGGGGGYSAKTISISSGQWGSTYSYSVPDYSILANGGNATIAGTSVSITGGGGSVGGPGSPGAGGGASGGDTNTGGANASGYNGGAGANGGAGGEGQSIPFGSAPQGGNPPGGGGGGGYNAEWNAGASGQVKFSWTC